jgi:GDP-4-dehydro-6-deoxy-D-mannose reductase
MEINAIGFINLLQVIRKMNLNTRVLAVGSCEEYGSVDCSDKSISENVPLQPSNPYSISKVTQEYFGEIYAKAYDMDIVFVRAFNHIGPGQKEGFAISDFTKKIALIEKGLIEPILRVGNLSAKRDFTDVRDIVKAYYLLMQKGASGEIYNVGSNKAYSIEYALELLKQMSSKKFEVVIDKSKFRPVDTPVITCDNSKLLAATGWNPEIELASSLEDTLEYWRENIAKAEKI